MAVVGPQPVITGILLPHSIVPSLSGPLTDLKAATRSQGATGCAGPDAAGRLRSRGCCPASVRSRLP